MGFGFTSRRPVALLRERNLACHIVERVKLAETGCGGPSSPDDRDDSERRIRFTAYTCPCGRDFRQSPFPDSIRLTRLKVQTFPSTIRGFLFPDSIPEGTFVNFILLHVVPCRCVIVALLAISLCLPGSYGRDAVQNDLDQFYGFTGVELFKLDKRAFNLVTGDFDSDGLNDLLVADNRGSCFRFLRQQSPADRRKPKPGRFPNDLDSDGRFEIRQISVDKQIIGLTVGDFNADNRDDVAYIGAPDRLVVRYQPESPKADWTEKWSVRLPGLTPASWMISSGDLNSDRLDDVVILSKSVTYVVYQGEKGQMLPPEKLINTSGQLSLIQVADIDGDGRNDLCYQANEGSNRGLCARLQTTDGRLGPELCFDLKQPRSVTLSNVDLEPGHEIMTVESRTGRVVVSKLKKAPAQSEELPSRLVQFGIGEATGSQSRAIGMGDIDGDGLVDVVVTDPVNAQVLVYRQNGIDGLGTAEEFPSLLGTEDVCVADIDGDNRAEVILMSSEEEVIAVSRFTDGRLSFPQTVARSRDEFEFASIELIPTKAGQNLAVCQKKGSSRSAEVILQQLSITPEGDWKPAADDMDLDRSVLGSRGIDLLSMDIDDNGAMDLILVPRGSSESPIHILRGDETGVFATKGDSRIELSSSGAGEMFVHGNSLLIARNAFARALTFGESGWSVQDQFNAGESNARIVGVAALDLDGEEGAEIVQVDTGIKKLRVLRKSGGIYRAWKEVDLGILRFSSAHVMDFNGDGRDDLLLFGDQHFSVLYSGRIDSSLEEIATYESDREEAYAADVIAGDINGDNAVDLTIIDTGIDGLELLRFDQSTGLESATYFRVYEEKRLVSESDSRGTEPREGMVVDVTGDGRNDLVLLCHDRLILYPQDPGEADKTSSAVPAAK